MKCGVLIKNTELAKLLVKWNHTKITADSAEPKSIDELKRAGLSIYGATKGAGSVEHGMKWLASLNEIIIDNKRCPNAADEFLSYEYMRTKDGEIISGYPDKNNHFIDACRYACENIMVPVQKIIPSNIRIF
jgi:phage terminase large subunit